MFHHTDTANELHHTNSPLAMSPIFRKQEFIELWDSVIVVFPWENDRIAQRCVMKLTGVPPHVVQLAAADQNNCFGNTAMIVRCCLKNGGWAYHGLYMHCQNGRWAYHGLYMHCQWLKWSLFWKNACRKQFVEEELDQWVQTTANNMPLSANDRGADHAELTV